MKVPRCIGCFYCSETENREFYTLIKGNFVSGQSVRITQKQPEKIVGRLCNQCFNFLREKGEEDD